MKKVVPLLVVVGLLAGYKFYTWQQAANAAVVSEAAVDELATSVDASAVVEQAPVDALEQTTEVAQAEQAPVDQPVTA